MIYTVSCTVIKSNVLGRVLGRVRLVSHCMCPFVIPSPTKLRRWGVVVVNHCFTSLFGTNGLLSDMVYDKNVVVNWWDEWCTDDDVRVRVIGYGGLLRAFSFVLPIRGSGHVYVIYPQRCPDGRRLGLRCAIQCWNSVAFRATPLSLGRIVPGVTIGRVTPFIPSERPNVIKHAIATAYTSASSDARAALAPQLSGGTRVCHWQYEEAAAFLGWLL